MGLSVVGPDRELMYASVTGIRLRATASAGRMTFEGALQVGHPPTWPRAACLYFGSCERCHALLQLCIAGLSKWLSNVPRRWQYLALTSYACTGCSKGCCSGRAGRVQEVQVDNSVAGAAHPVALAVPRPPPVWPAFHHTLATVTATVTGPPRKTAATLRLAIWRRQPGGDPQPGSLRQHHSTSM